MRKQPAYDFERLFLGTRAAKQHLNPDPLPSKNKPPSLTGFREKRLSNHGQSSKQESSSYKPTPPNPKVIRASLYNSKASNNNLASMHNSRDVSRYTSVSSSNKSERMSTSSKKGQIINNNNAAHLQSNPNSSQKNSRVLQSSAMIAPSEPTDEEISRFFETFEYKVAVRYAAVNASQEPRYSIKRNLISQIEQGSSSLTTSARRSRETSVSYISRNINGTTHHEKLHTQPVQPHHASSHSINQLHQKYGRINLQSCSSSTSFQSSSNKNLHTQESTDLRGKIRQSEEKLNHLRQKLSNLYNIKNEASHKNISISIAQKNTVSGAQQAQPRASRLHTYLIR